MWPMNKVMRRFNLILMICLVGFGAACEREQAAPSIPAPEEVASDMASSHDEPSPKEADEDEEMAESPPRASFESWPGREEHRTFELMWLGGDEEYGLREEPAREADVAGVVSFLDGDQLEWTQTVVQVLKPRIYEAEQAMSWSGLSYDAEYMELEAQERRYELQEGDRISLYQYGGEGSCYWGIEQEILLGACPTDHWRVLDEGANSEEQAPWQPLEQEWWVKVKSDDVEGWLLVDEAPVEVIQRYIDGFDVFEE